MFDQSKLCTACFHCLFIIHGHLHLTSMQQWELRIILCCMWSSRGRTLTSLTADSQRTTRPHVDIWPLTSDVQPLPSDYMTDPGALCHCVDSQAIYMFCALAVVCDDYFVPSLEKICEVGIVGVNCQSLFTAGVIETYIHRINVYCYLLLLVI